jgi:hypothetical protein
MENGKKPAFVTKIHYKGQLTPMPGLTKREYFAAVAMQGLLACPDIAASREAIAEESVKQSDELLKALESKSE